MSITEEEIKEAHKHSSYHSKALKESDLCGCFYCRKVFSPNEINEWTDSKQTALCPRCGIDSVLPGKDKRFIDKDFLIKMSMYWFNLEYNEDGKLIHVWKEE